MAGSPSFKKREKERARQERQREKAAKRNEKRQDRTASRPTGAPGEDPDIAGIVPGPQGEPPEGEAS